MTMRTFPWRRMALAALGLMVSGVSLVILARAFDVGQVMAVLRRADPVFASLAIGTLAFSIVVRTARWRALLPGGGGNTPLVSVVPVVLIGYLGNSVAPLRFGDGLRAAIAARRFRLGTMEVLGSVITERLVDTGALAVVLVGAVVSLQGPAWLVQSGAAVAAICGLAVVMVYAGPSWVERVAPCLSRLAGGLPPIARYARRVLRGVRADPRNVAVALGLSVVAWLVDGVTFWLCSQSLGFDIPLPLTLAVAGSAALGMAAPSGPAAMGTFELAGTAAAVALGMPGESALALVIFGHVLTVLPLVVGGGLSLALARPGIGTNLEVARESGDGFRVAEPVEVKP